MPGSWPGPTRPPRNRSGERRGRRIRRLPRGPSRPTRRRSEARRLCCRRRPAPGSHRTGVLPARSRRRGGRTRPRSCARAARAVRLVAQAPQPNAVWLDSPVSDASVRKERPRWMVRVLDQVECLQDAPGSEVERQHRLRANGPGPGHELIQPEVVGLQAVPGEVQALGPFLPRTHAIFPAIARHEVAARISNRGYAQLADQLDHVAAEPPVVGGGVARLIDPV